MTISSTTPVNTGATNAPSLDKVKADLRSEPSRMPGTNTEAPSVMPGTSDPSGSVGRVLNAYA